MPSTRTGKIPFRTYETYYEIFGDIENSPHPPLVVLHGGPAGTHSYMVPIAQLTERYNIPVVFYDQLGCGASSQPLDVPKEFWTIELFLDELDNVVDKLKIKDSYYLLGSSWGGVLAASHAIRKPKGLKKLILACTFPAMHMWTEGLMRARAQMPGDGGAKLEKHEREGTTDSAEYEELGEWFDSHYGCRVRPLPHGVRVSYEEMMKGPVNNALFGPNDLEVTGNLKGWTIIDQLHEINVPTMVCHGAYDPVDDIVVKTFLDNIPHVDKYFKFPESSHVPHCEETDLYVKEVGDFLVA